MMKKCISFTLILILLLFTLTGCYDSTGVEDFYYIVALAIDKAESNLISLSIQIGKSSTGSDSATSQSSEYKIFTVDCESIESGINILNNYLNKKINLSHCSAIIFSEEIAREGIKNYINILGNDTEIRPSCNLLISSKSAYDVLDKVSNSGEGFSSRLYEYILHSVDYTGYTVDSTFTNFFSRINTEQTQATAIYTVVNDDTIQNSGVAVFKEDVMLGTLSPLQTIAHLMVTDELESCMISVESPFQQEQLIDLNLKKNTTPIIDVSLINHTPFITINASIEASINSSGEQFDYTVPENIKLVEQAANQYLNGLLKEYLYIISKEYNSDIAGFSGMLASKVLTADEFEKVHWNEIFQDSYFEVNVDTKITSSHLFNKE